MKHLLAAARQCALRIPAEAAVCCAAAFLLTAVSTGGQYAPWALAAVAVAGVGWRGLAATACAGVGALAFLDFQPGLRHAAAAVLIFCANTAFCPSRLYRHPRFRPTAAVCAAALTQLPYLIARSGREWLLCGASLALLYGTVRLTLASHAGARLPETTGAGAAAPAAAFQAVYDSLAAEMPLLRPENPAVLFDRAAEQVCRDCPLRADCWQSHYSDTYNAFNDACPVLCSGDGRWRRISHCISPAGASAFPGCWRRWTASCGITCSGGCTTPGWTRPIVWRGSSTGRWHRR